MKVMQFYTKITMRKDEVRLVGATKYRLSVLDVVSYVIFQQTVWLLLAINSIMRNSEFNEIS